MACPNVTNGVMVPRVSMPSVVEREAEQSMNAVFAAWLVGELEAGALIAAPEGERAALEFGAVLTVGREVEMAWMRFVGNPGRVMAQLMREAARLDRPVIVGQREGQNVWLAVGSHCAAGSADAVVLG